MASVVNRVVGAMALRAATFEEVEHDQSATWPAALVVAAAHAAQSVAGSVFLTAGGVLLSVALGLLGWVIGAGVLLLVGTKMFPGKSTEADMGQMLRTLGFAEAPGLLGVLALLPVTGLGWTLIVVTSIWILVAMVIAVRQALDYETTTRALVVCIVAWLIMLAISLTAGFFGIGAATVGGRLM
jgi:hypothetical protein